jgi:poly-gamma-glutamate capsule biosynthesis protein CapA/YwtB (metallophosphatase superfamily)
MPELPENSQRWQGTSRASVMMAVIAVMICLLPLLFGCSSEGSRDQSHGSGRTDEGQRSSATRGGQTGDAGDGSTGARRTKTQAALVPIAHLSSTAENISMQELSGTQNLAVGRGYRDEADELIDNPRFESFDSEAAVVDHVSKTPEALGLVPWDEVGPRVKALSVDGKSLLDSERSGHYPLALEGATVPDPEELRRVVVGGDIVLDRGQYYMVIQKGMGIDFPLDGGYAAVTSRVPEQSAYSETGIIHQFTARRTGRAGAVREYLSGADLTLANFENPVIRDAVYHPDATTFTGDLRLMPVLDQAGMDGVTLGNNHILDAGTTGLNETMRHLDDAGIAHAGAGMDLAEARKPMVFDLRGTKVGVLSYLDVPSYDWAWATQTAPGTAPLLENVMEEDIKRLRPRVDLILVMPHWGKEYIATPEPQQVDLAHTALDAGADLVIGDHAHWPKGIELYEGKPIFYGVGNFLFDQSWSEETSTGIFAEITLYRDDVVQVRPVPFIMLDYAQPNFLMPGAGGDRALRKIFAASLGPEFESYGKPAH